MTTENKDKFMNKALIFVAIFIVLFTITMIVLFCIYQEVPDQLIISVFAATTGETSATAVIFSVKKIMDAKKGKDAEAIEDELD